jgi:hypothetical protein
VEDSLSTSVHRKKFAPHGWLGLGLTSVFWVLNWSLPGIHTQWTFFPLWLGFCLSVDALTLYRTGTSLLTRSWRKYIGLFLISAPSWWLFEAVNLRLQNWVYIGTEEFSSLSFGLWSSLNFTIVIPAVFGATELVSSFAFFHKLKKGPAIGEGLATTVAFFLAGWIMLAMLLVWPKIFFPFVWISIFFILAPINIWLGYRSLTQWVKKGNWRPVYSLWGGVLLTAFFWEMWNYFSYPKWVYHVPWGGWLKIFEMPLLGYGGYLPFALELFALYHLVAGLLGQKDSTYVKVEEPD